MVEFASFFAALADPTRLRLLHLMKDGEICVCFLQGVLKTNQPKISRHLAYLRNAGLVEGRQDGKWMHYSLKKLDDDFHAILVETLKHIAQEPQVSKDVVRLKGIQCCPSRYGFASPSKSDPKPKTRSTSIQP